MAWYYTEGTIKKIVIDDTGSQFSLAPAGTFCIERNGEKGIAFIKEGEKTAWDVRAEGEGELFATNISPDTLLLIKRDHLPVRVYVEDGNMVDVKRLEIKD